LLQTDSDEQADDDGSQVDKEVFPRVDGSVGGVNVEHGFGMFLTGWEWVYRTYDDFVRGRHDVRGARVVGQ
jgi:hypothetical protein